MKKYLITGFSGFVGKHFLDFLDNNGINSDILGLDVHEPDFDMENFHKIKCRFQKVNLLDSAAVEAIVRTFTPQYILHLASFSSVAKSWEAPIESFNNNTNIFLSLLEILRKLKLSPRILSIGSSEEYGWIAGEHLPLTENSPLNPTSPYAVARVAQEKMSKVYADAFGMDIILTRSFNHFGPGQKENFAIASFAKRLVQEKCNGALTCRLETGDITVIRDFLDVRDVVQAYYLLLEKGERGEVYNVCSGQGVSLREIIFKLAEKLDIKVDLAINETLIRPNDNPIIIGSSQKLQQELDWRLHYNLNRSLDDVIKYWKRKLCR